MPDYEIALRVVGTVEGTSRKLERPLGTVTAATEGAAIGKAAEELGEEGVYVARPAGSAVRKKVAMTQKPVVSEPDPDPDAPAA